MPVEALSDSLAVKLSEMERWAKNGHDLSPSDTLELIALLRKYMAHAETIERSILDINKILEGK